VTTMQTIPLNQLVFSPANVRKTGAKDGIDGLAASIAAHGLLQNLQVRPGDAGQYEVVAGGRRLAALRLLAKQQKITVDYPVPCHALDAEDAGEISLAENEMRLVMHPADQFEAFKKLADQGHGPEAIAARFGTMARIVEQRLKLAVVSPKLIALYRKGEMTLDCLMAFTVAEDHRQQEKTWKALPEWARERPDRIRDALTEKHVAADSSLAQFVGIAAYEAAGGAVLRDLFDDEGSGWLTDAALVNKLAAEKLDQAAAAVRGEGWKWVEIIPELSWEALKGFGKATPERTPPTAEQQREIEALTAEGDAIMEEHGEEPEDDAITERLWEIQKRIADLSEGEEAWPDSAKATAGVVIGIGHDGSLDIRRGLIRPEDKAAAKKADRAAHAADSGTKGKTAPVPGSGPGQGFSAALIEDLTAHRTAALQAMLANNPKVALAAVVHALALDLFYAVPGTGSVLRITSAVVDLARSAEGIEDTKAHQQLAATTKAVCDGLPEDPAKLWGWLTEQDQKTLLAVLAVCAGHTLDAVQKRNDPRPCNHADELAAALKLDMADWWQPTAEGYFARVSKQQALDAVAEGSTKEAAENLARLKKDELTKEAEKRLNGSRWLPAILRAA
jgi:ParB family transcriptional regulator, chromosome partitioning protein